MPKRYFVCDLIGTGTDDDPIRPAVAPHVKNWSAVYPAQDPATGQYADTKCLVIASDASLLRAIGKPGVDILPDFTLDARMSAMHSPTRTALRALMVRRGLDVSVLDNADGYRDVIRSIGQRLNPEFHEDGFDVSE